MCQNVKNCYENVFKLWWHNLHFSHRLIYRTYVYTHKMYCILYNSLKYLLGRQHIHLSCRYTHEIHAHRIYLVQHHTCVSHNLVYIVLICLLKWYTKLSNKTNGYYLFQAVMNISQPYFNDCHNCLMIWKHLEFYRQQNHRYSNDSD